MSTSETLLLTQPGNGDERDIATTNSADNNNNNNNNTNGAKIESDRNGEEQAVKSQVDGRESQEHISGGSNDRLHVDETAAAQDSIESTNATLQDPNIPKDRGLTTLIRMYDGGCRGVLGEKNGLGNPLQTLSIMEHLAKQQGIWGPFLVVTPESTIQSWRHEIVVSNHSLAVVPYWDVLHLPENLQQAMLTQSSSLHIMIISYNVISSDTTFFRSIGWQYINLFEARTLQGSDISKLQFELGFWKYDQSRPRSVTKNGQINKQPTTDNPDDKTRTLKGKAGPSRRSRGRVDGLEHLSESPFTETGYSGEMQPLHGIVFCLVRLNVCIMWLRDRGGKSLNSYPYDELHLIQTAELLTTDESKYGYKKKAIMTDSIQDNNLAEYINTISHEHLIQRIQDAKAIRYISKFYDRMLSYADKWTIQRKLIDTDPNFDLPKGFKDFRKSDYVNLCMVNSRYNRRDLRTLYNIITQLREFIISAHSLGLLDEASSRQLKAKMIQWQVGYQETSDALGLPRETLVWDSKMWWVDPQDTELTKHFLDSEPKNVTTAFPPASSMNASLTLSFIVPMLSLLSCIPTALAWANSPHQHGSASDADFFQLIASTAMQLLGNITLIIPTFSNARLAQGQYEWFWTWILAGSSTLCAFLAVPLYLIVPTEWSAVVAFVGNVMQAFVTLQLMFAI